MRPVVRMGDPLHPFGGEVLEGHFLAFGKPVACLGDAARCNQHGLTRINQGVEGSTLEGQQVVLDGYRCECGCTVVSTLGPTDLVVAP